MIRTSSKVATVDGSDESRFLAISRHRQMGVETPIYTRNVVFSISSDWDSEKARARHSTGSHGGRRMDLGEVGLRSSHAGVAGYENYVCDDLCEVQANVIGLLVLFCTLALPVLLGYGLLHNLDTPSFKGYNEDKT